MSETTETATLTGDVSDDLVLRFRTVYSNVMGRVVRLGSTFDTIVSRHKYPKHVTETLGQALALVAMLGTSLKGDGAILTLQAKSDGLISLLVADYESSGAVRGYATYRDQDASKDAPVFGEGSLAMTIDPGQGLDRYQGIVALEGQSLTDAAHTYFRQSEQLPTFVRLAVAHHFDSAADGDGDQWSWRAGGLMIQHLSRDGGTADPIDEPQQADEEPPAVGEDNEDWQRARHLAVTVEDHELLDPGLAPDRLLYRLFHEEGVVAFPAQVIRDDCRCSREKISNMLRSLQGQFEDMTDESGKISVTCEFCSTKYAFDPDAFETATPDKK